MKYGYIISVTVLFFLFFAGYFHLNSKIDSKKTSVVNLEELYSEFDFTMESNKKFKQLTKQRTVAIDSINVMVSMLKNQGTDVAQTMSTIEKLKYNASVLHKENEAIKYELEQQIWNQLNQYLYEFGQSSKDYSIILGSMGDGSIIYAEDLIDITDDAISFVNNKYNGLN